MQNKDKLDLSTRAETYSMQIIKISNIIILVSWQIFYRLQSFIYELTKPEINRALNVITQQRIQKK